MALPIITAIRQRRDLKESVLHTAQELAHRASIYGVARVSLNYLARKCHCCKQTIINHLKKLIDLGIVAKTVLWIQGKYCEVNTYRFLIAWESPGTLQGGSQKSRRNSPHIRGREEKYGSVEEKKRLDAKGLSFLTPGSALYHLVVEQQAVSPERC